jgi:hypothetical protein
MKAIRANQYLTEAWTNLTALYLLGGKWAEAEEQYRMALAIRQKLTDDFPADQLLNDLRKPPMAGGKGPITTGRWKITRQKK